MLDEGRFNERHFRAIEVLPFDVKDLPQLDLLELLKLFAGLSTWVHIAQA